MPQRTVRDLMVPLEEYAVVDPGASLLEAVLALDRAQGTLPPGRQPHRAVLVAGPDGKVVGKLGHLAFLKALEPRYDAMGDLATLSRVGLSSDFITSMIGHMELWKDDFEDICRRARQTRIGDVMRPVTESISENATLREALHNIIVRQSLSLLVTRDTEVVGILRLSDLFAAVTDQIRGCAEGQTSTCEED
jgi:CBS domain-containing protein